MATLINSILGQVASGVFKLCKGKDIDLGDAVQLSSLGIPSVDTVNNADYMMIDQGTSVILVDDDVAGSTTLTRVAHSGHGLTNGTYVHLESTSGTGYNDYYQIIETNANDYLLNVEWADGLSGVDFGNITSTEKSMQKVSSFKLWEGILAKIKSEDGIIDDSDMIADDIITNAHIDASFWSADTQVRIADTSAFSGYMLEDDTDFDTLEECLVAIDAWRPGVSGYVGYVGYCPIDFMIKDGGSERYAERTAGSLMNTHGLMTISWVCHVRVPYGFKAYKAKVLTQVFPSFGAQVIRLSHSSIDTGAVITDSTTTSNSLVTWNFTPSDYQDYGVIEVDLEAGCSLTGAEVLFTPA